MANSPVKGRTIRAQDIAAAALYLASEAGQAVNGHTLVVDLGTISGVTGGPGWQSASLRMCEWWCTPEGVGNDSRSNMCMACLAGKPLVSPCGVLHTHDLAA